MFMTSCFIGMISHLKRCNEIENMSSLFYIEDDDGKLFFLLCSRRDNIMSTYYNIYTYIFHMTP